jgi:hypothetical protein
MLPQALIESLQNVKGFDEEAFKKCMRLVSR